MSIKNIVKVMNFHSLLRVDSAKNLADKYGSLEQELTGMIDCILNNRNLLLDQKILLPKKDKPVLNIYIGNDFGFCGNFNSNINKYCRQDNKGDRILIGRKINQPIGKNVLVLNKEDFENRFSEIKEVIKNAIEKLKYREINLVYTKYNNLNSLITTKKTVFPITIDPEAKAKNQYNEDFGVESDINVVLTNLVVIYICYQIRIAEASSWAAENVMRQQVTKDSLHKIDERETLTVMKKRKEENYKEFQKIIENFIKIRYSERRDK